MKGNNLKMILLAVAAAVAFDAQAVVVVPARPAPVVARPAPVVARPAAPAARPATPSKPATPPAKTEVVSEPTSHPIVVVPSTPPVRARECDPKLDKNCKK